MAGIATGDRPYGAPCRSGAATSNICSYAVQECCLLSVDATHLTTAQEEEEYVSCVY